MSSTAPDKPFFDALLTEGNDLWSAIMRCNAHPDARTEDWSLLPVSARSSLEQWLAQVPDSGRNALDMEKSVTFVWNFEEESRKLALLDDAQLCRLAAVVGVTIHAPALARIVERQARLQCREALGESLFDYAQTRGQYQTGAAGDIMAKRDTDLPLPERCHLHGWLSLYFCSLRWPTELRGVFQRRLALIGPEASKVNVRDALSEADWQILWRLLKKCLLREVAPTWASYFNA